MAERKFSAVISIGAELGASFRATFGGLDSRIKAVGSSLKGLNDSQKGIASYAKALDSVKVARDEMAVAGKRLADLRGQSHFVEDADGMAQLNKEIAAQRTAYDKTRAALTKKTAALEKERAALKKAGVDTSRLSEEMERLGREAQQATAKLAAMGKIKGVTAQLGASMRQFRADALAAGVAVSAVGFSVWKVIKGFADMGDEAQETASALGMTAQELLALRYAAERVGVDTAKFDMAMNALNQRMDDAAEGSEKASRAFDELGLDAELLQAMSGAERMATLAEAFRNYRGQVPKAALATDLFGARAYKMANVLELGADGLRKLREEGEKTGFILDDKQLAQAEKFDQAFGRFKATLIGIRNEIGSALLPVVNRFFDFFSEHTGILKVAIAGFAAMIGGVAVLAVAKLGLTAVTTAKQLVALASAMRALGAIELTTSAGGLGKIAAAAKSVMPWLTTLSSTVIPAVGAALTGIGGTLAAAASAVTGFATAIAGAVFAIPGIGWIAAAVAGVAFAVWKYWEPIKTFLGGFWDGFTSGFRDAFGALMAELRPIGDAFRAVFSAVVEAIRPVIDVLVIAFAPQIAAIKTAVGAIGDAFGWAFGKARDAVSWLVTPFQQTNEQMAKTASVGQMVGRALAEFVLAPLKLITGALKLVRTGLASIGIGKKPELGEDSAEGSEAGPSVRASVPLIQPGATLADALSGPRRDRAAPAAESPVGEVPRLPSVPVAAAAGRNQSTATTTNNLTINAAPGMDERKLADEVMRRLEQKRAQEQRGALFDVVPAY